MHHAQQRTEAEKKKQGHADLLVLARRARVSIRSAQHLAPELTTLALAPPALQEFPDFLHCRRHNSWHAAHLQKAQVLTTVQTHSEASGRVLTSISLVA